MCIRDRNNYINFIEEEVGIPVTIASVGPNREQTIFLDSDCLLYTSDAADERSSVDLGGRRIIKKKKKLVLSKSSEHKITITLT